MEIECKGLKRDYADLEHNEVFTRDNKEYTKIYKEDEDGNVLINLAYAADGDVQFFDDCCQVMKKGCQKTPLPYVRGGQVFRYEFEFYIRVHALDESLIKGVINLEDGSVRYLDANTLVEVIDAKLVNA